MRRILPILFAFFLCLPASQSWEMGARMERRLVAATAGGGGFTLGWDSAVAVSTVGDSIVSTEGTLIEAVQLGSTTDRTVNGVTFDGQGSRDDLGSSSGNTSFYQDGVIGFQFEFIMDANCWSSGSPKTITFTGLTPSKTYLIQVFASDDRNATLQAREQTYTINGVTSGSYQNGLSYSLIGRFVATGATMDCIITSTADVGVAGFQIRQLD